MERNIIFIVTIKASDHTLKKIPIPIVSHSFVNKICFTWIYTEKKFKQISREN